MIDNNEWFLGKQSDDFARYIDIIYLLYIAWNYQWVYGVSGFLIIVQYSFLFEY